MQPSLAKSALVLGLISAMGPISIDMYLPALPLIGRDLGASIAQVQGSLMIFMGAVALFQVVYGPISDMVGRKPPLYAGVALFMLGAAGAALSPTVEWLIASRLVQGIGACACMSLPRAIVRDYHTGPEAARLLSLLMLVFSVCPILAPLGGSLVIELSHWRVIFWIICGSGLIALLLITFALEETRPKELRVESGFSSAFRSYRTLLGDRKFVGVALIGGFGMSSFFAFLATSSFVYIEHYGLTPTQYSLAFSVNAIGFIGMSQFTAVFARRFGFERMIRAAVAGYFTVMVSLFVIFLLGVDRLEIMMVFILAGFTCVGLIIPGTSVLALDRHGRIAGSAAALLGTIQMMTGAIVMALVSFFFDGSAMPMIGAIATCSTIAFVLTQIILRPTDREAVTAGHQGAA